MTMLILKVVMPLMLDCALKVRVAVVTWFAFNTVFSRFQLSVIGPLAVVRLQLFCVMRKFKRCASCVFNVHCSSDRVAWR